MKTAALVIAAGSVMCAGTPAAMYMLGAAPCAQHMIASFRKAGVDRVFLVTDEATKKLEKQMAASGVFLIREKGSAAEAAVSAVKKLPEGFDRLLLCPADRPLVMPETIEKMLSVRGDVVLPLCKGREGGLWLLSMKAAMALEAKAGQSLSELTMLPGFERTEIETGDAGILMGPKKAGGDELALERHSAALMRPVLELSVAGEQSILDRRLVRLLMYVDQLRSVRAACAMSGMSYSVAWNLLNCAEEQLGCPLVLRNQGGRSGSGTELTEKGRDILAAYRGFEAEMNEKMHILFEECFRGLL